jgi:hypothetical protein
MPGVRSTLRLSGSDANRDRQRVHMIRAAEATRGPGWNIFTFIDRVCGFGTYQSDPAGSGVTWSTAVVSTNVLP